LKKVWRIKQLIYFYNALIGLLFKIFTDNLVFMLGRQPSADVPFALVFVEYFTHTAVDGRICRAQAKGNVLVYGAFAYSVLFGGVSYRRAALYYVFAEHYRAVVK
jgi:hypothetical protein